MPIKTTCRNCNTELTFEEAHAGRTVECPNCRQEIVVPGLIAAPQEGEAAPALNEESVDHQMPGGALILAAAAALAGAVIWAVLVYTTNYEVGFVAWGIGALVGAAALKSGGRGPQMGVACAVLALVSILAGKLIATQLFIDKELDEVTTNFTTEAHYTELKKVAENFSALPPDASAETLKRFMVEHKYTEREVPENVTDEELDFFRTYSIPPINEFLAENPSYERWRDETSQAIRDDFGSEVSLFSAVADNIDVIDLIFAFLGVSTAYGLVNRGRKQRPRRTRRVVSQ